jgi:hypothetical protein
VAKSAPHELLNVLSKVFRQTRLPQEDVRACFEGAASSPLVREAGNENDRDVTCCRVLLHASRRSDAVQAWHRKVEHDHVRAYLQCRLNRGFPVRNCLNEEAALREVETIELPSIERIVSNQYQTGLAGVRG